ncbi:uncharacterized protein LOC144327314 [Podarcis muralis]
MELCLNEYRTAREELLFHLAVQSPYWYCCLSRPFIEAAKQESAFQNTTKRNSAWKKLPPILKMLYTSCGLCKQDENWENMREQTNMSKRQGEVSKSCEANKIQNTNQSTIESQSCFILE